MSVPRFHAAYDAVMSRWPVAVEPADLPSPYGTTRVCSFGRRDGPPLVLLPGGDDTCTVWRAVATTLAPAFRVHAVDLLGSAGRSRAHGRPLRTRADLMSWLDGVLDGLGLTQTLLGGHSYGGWMALRYALHAPPRVRRLALLDPTTCFAGFRPGYLMHALPMLVHRRPARIRAFLEWETGGLPVDPDWLELAALAAELPKPSIVLPRQPRPDELRQITTPTLVLLAEHSRTHDIRKVAATARRLMPVAGTAVLPGVSHHSMPTGNPAGLGRELLSFLAAQSHVPPS